MESCVETIAKTLPICQVRKVAYATFFFLFLQIFHSGEAYLVEFDNPSCVFIRDGKIVNYAYETREIEGKKIHEYRFQVQEKRLLCPDERRCDLCRSGIDSEPSGMDVGSDGGVYA